MTSPAAQAAGLQRTRHVLRARDGACSHSSRHSRGHPGPCGAEVGWNSTRAVTQLGLLLGCVCMCPCVLSPVCACTRVHGCRQRLVLRTFPTSGGIRPGLQANALSIVLTKPHQAANLQKHSQLQRGPRWWCLALPPIGPRLRRRQLRPWLAGGAPLPAASSQPSQTCPYRVAAAAEYLHPREGCCTLPPACKTGAGTKDAGSSSVPPLCPQPFSPPGHHTRSYQHF